MQKEALQRLGCSVVLYIGDRCLPTCRDDHAGYFSYMLALEVNHYAEQRSYRALCLYNTALFPAEFLLAIERAHPSVLVE